MFRILTMDLIPKRYVRFHSLSLFTQTPNMLYSEQFHSQTVEGLLIGVLEVHCRSCIVVIFMIYWGEGGFLECFCEYISVYLGWKI